MPTSSRWRSRIRQARVSARRHQGRLGLGSRAAPGNYEIELGTPRARSSSTSRRPAGGRAVKLWFPAARAHGADRRRPRRPYDFDSLAKAGTMLGSGDHRRRRLDAVLDVALKLAKFYATSPAGNAPVPRGTTGRCDARAHRRRRGDADGPRHHVLVQEHIIGNCLCVLGDAMAMRSAR